MILFALIMVLLVWDIAEDLTAGTTFFHALKRDLKKARAEAVHWQAKERDLLNRLREAIDQQFTKWDFSPTEKQIAAYLLKGMSLKEIAEVKGSTFNSIRQQAHVLYSKAGLGGRAELSAFFLGDLLP